MKAASMKLLINELKLKTVERFARERDKQGRRGREARLSAAMMGHTKAFLAPDAVDDPAIMEHEPVLYVPGRLRAIDWEKVAVIHATTHGPLDVIDADVQVCVLRGVGAHWGSGLTGLL
jgi:hypothetical protein